jgi:predicted HAD superfamily phosphohydrolase
MELTEKQILMLYNELGEDAKLEILESIQTENEHEFFQWLDLKRELDEVFSQNLYDLEMNQIMSLEIKAI